MMGTVGLVSMISLCGHKKQVTYKELIFIWYAGLIRGAIAFGLVLRIEDVVNRSVIVSTSLFLVVVTTVLFGCTMPLLSRCLFKEKQELNIYELEAKKQEEKEEARKASVN